MIFLDELFNVVLVPKCNVSMSSLQKPEQKLYDAVDGNKAKVVTELLDSGVDVNAKVGIITQSIPLHYCTCSENQELPHYSCLYHVFSSLPSVTPFKIV